MVTGSSPVKSSPLHQPSSSMNDQRRIENFYSSEISSPSQFNDATPTIPTSASGILKQQREPPPLPPTSHMIIRKSASNTNMSQISTSNNNNNPISPSIMAGANSTGSLLPSSFVAAPQPQPQPTPQQQQPSTQISASTPVINGSQSSNDLISNGGQCSPSNGSSSSPPPTTAMQQPQTPSSQNSSSSSSGVTSRLSHEQFRHHLQMVVNPGDPRYRYKNFTKIGMN